MANITPTSKGVPSVRRSLTRFFVLPILVTIGVFGYLAWMRTAPPSSGAPFTGAPIATVPIKGLTAELLTQDGQLRAVNGNPILIQFRNGHSELVDVGEVTFEMGLKNPGMVMHSIGKVLRTKTAGEYRTTVGPPMPGEWKADLGISGPQGHAQTNFTLTVK